MNEKELIEYNLLNRLYSYNLFSIKSICQFFNIWDNYSDDDKYLLENFTYDDSIINKHFNFNGIYNTKLRYGEISRHGVDSIISKINKYKTLSNIDSILDIGSGNGKMLLHIAIRTSIDLLCGVEIVPHRVRYSKSILSDLDLNKKVFLIEKDYNNFDISLFNIIIFNGFYESYESVINILNKAKDGSHIITTFDVSDICSIKKEEFYVRYSMKEELKMFYFIK